MRPGIAILLSLCILALLIAFLSASRGAGANQPDAEKGFWDEHVERFVRRKVEQTYVDELDDTRGRQAFYRAMDAFVRFDGYCDFIPPEEHRKWREDTAGRYAGLGIKINQVEEGLHIVGVFPGGPAATAGLRVDDTIVRAAARDLAGMEVDVITSLLKGLPGSQVTVGVIRGPRPEEGPHRGPVEDIVVTRATIVPPTVFTRRVGPAGTFLQVRVTDFTEQTLKAYDAVMDDVANGVQPAAGLLLDLRHNGGGVLGVAVQIAGRFLRPGRLVVRMEGRGVNASKDYRARPSERKLLDIPLVLLVDEWSASASEIVAGALQDHRRAVLVGARTYGKFLVQSINSIPGRDMAVKLTTSRYYTPSGRSYQGSLVPNEVGRPAGRHKGSGLIPDVVIELSDEESTTLQKLWADEEGKPWGEKPRFEDVGADHVDPQLERALKLLQGEVVLQKLAGSRRPGRRNG